MITATLNRDEHSMCFIGRYTFSFDDCGPKSIDVEQLSNNEINQFVYNHRRGVLDIGGVEELLSKAKDLPAASSKFVTGKEQPVQQKMEPRDIIEQEELAFRKLLRGKIEEIKDTVAVMSLAKVKKLIEFEKETKNRKKLLTYLKGIIDQHTMAVTKKVGPKDGLTFAPANLGIDNKYLDNISEVEESDVEQMVLNPINSEE